MIVTRVDRWAIYLCVSIVVSRYSNKRDNVRQHGQQQLLDGT